MTKTKNISEKKKELRQRMSAIRDRIDESERKRQEEETIYFLKRSGILNGYSDIYLYASFRSEFPTERISELLLEMGKRVMFPRIDSFGDRKVMNFYPVKSKSSMKKGYMGIMEPKGKEPLLIPGLMFVPGLAFDRKGGRLGYGGGFYDFFIGNADVDIKTVGLCFKEQMIGEVTMTPKDIRIDGVLTGGEFLERKEIKYELHGGFGKEGKEGGDNNESSQHKRQE